MHVTQNDLIQQAKANNTAHAWRTLWHALEDNDAAPLGQIAYNLGALAHKEGDRRLAARAFDLALTHAKSQAVRTQAGNALLMTLANEAPFAPAKLTQLPFTPPTITVVCCSHQEARFQRFCERNQHWLSHVKVVRVADAKGMGEAYTRALTVVSTECVVLCHDDIALAHPQALTLLSQALLGADLVAPVGSEVLHGVTWRGAGNAHCHGVVAYPAQEGLMVTAYRLPRHLSVDLEVLDGCFFAGRTKCIKSIGFSPLLAHHFHGYDVDFSARALLAGASLSLVTGLGLIHDSQGDYHAKAWVDASIALKSLHPKCQLESQSAVANAVLLKDSQAYLALEVQLRELAQVRHTPLTVE